MKWRLMAVGRGMPEPVRMLVDDYTKRLKRYGQFELIEIAEAHRQGGLSPNKAMVQEANRLKKQLKQGDGVLVVLDSRGQVFSSEKWASRLNQWRQDALGPVTFIIGGPDGVAPELVKQADLRLSLGSMTFPHMLARVLLLEQLYRAMTIIHGVPYHR
ncbi:MAG: 23S rRNA (pseudouridine(1915)-N(3))-methyltransferase RlmH [Magnetococcales bacterium]|nr:23S rRNA (pseudouridine(1915)-N(3))-methyltransferase RlmH [Magnetococcales bacterium]